jgi:hypothetical protein
VLLHDPRLLATTAFTAMRALREVGARATREARNPEGLMEFSALVPQLLSLAREDA